jgi:ubiquinone/menaquinone biosynthesis C-methylase UbiE
MRLDIYDKWGPAGAGVISQADNVVSVLWFRRTLDTLNTTFRRKPFCCLEIGGGAGGVLNIFKRKLPLMAAVACDIYIPAVKQGGAMFPDIGFFASDGCRLACRDKKIDVVIVHDVLEHVEEPQAMLADAYRVLKPGGTLHLFVPCEGQPGTLHALFRNNPKEKYGHIQNYRRKDVIEMLQNVGFVIKTKLDSFHFAGQMSDVLSYYRDDLRLRKVKKMVAVVVGILARIGYVESKLMTKFPGLCLEIVAVK